MKRLRFFSILLIVISLFLGCSKNRINNDNVKIATSVSIISSILNDILPSKYESFYIIPENANPHTFTVSPDVAIKLSESNYVIYMGANFDDNWIKSISLPSGVKEINLSSYVKLDKNNPHYWMAVPMFVQALDSLFNYFNTINKDTLIEQKYIAFKDSLVNLHDKYKKKFSSYKNLKVVSLVPAFSWLLDDMGVEEVDILIKSGGGEPSPVDIANFIKKVKTNNISVILALKGGNDNYIGMIEEQLPNTKILYMSPILGRVEDNNSFIGLIEYNYKVLYDGLCSTNK